MHARHGCASSVAHAAGNRLSCSGTPVSTVTSAERHSARLRAHAHLADAAAGELVQNKIQTAAPAGDARHQILHKSCVPAYNSDAMSYWILKGRQRRCRLTPHHRVPHELCVTAGHAERALCMPVQGAMLNWLARVCACRPAQNTRQRIPAMPADNEVLMRTLIRATYMHLVHQLATCFVACNSCAVQQLCCRATRRT